MHHNKSQEISQVLSKNNFNQFLAWVPMFGMQGWVSWTRDQCPKSVSTILGVGVENWS